MKHKHISTSTAPFHDIFTNRVSACEEHMHCEDVTLTEIKLLCITIEGAIDGSDAAIQELDPHSYNSWTMGDILIGEMIMGKVEWDMKECNICQVLEFLSHEACLPFLCGLVLSGNENVYRRCIEGLRSCGQNVEGLMECIRSYCEAITAARK